MKFWIDIDDTISFTDEAVIQDASRYHTEVLKKVLPEIKPRQSENHYYFIEILGWTREEALRYLNDRYPACLENIRIKPGAAETIAWLQKNGHTVTILTSRVSTPEKNAEAVSVKWLHANGINPDGIILNCKDKGAFLKNEKGVFIDDAFDHTGAVAENKDITVFQIRSAFGKENPDSRVRHFSTWPELREMLTAVFPQEFGK